MTSKPTARPAATIPDKVPAVLSALLPMEAQLVAVLHDPNDDRPQPYTFTLLSAALPR